jgi:hypothetical protein
MVLIDAVLERPTLDLGVQLDEDLAAHFNGGTDLLKAIILLAQLLRTMNHIAASFPSKLESDFG